MLAVGTFVDRSESTFMIVLHFSRIAPEERVRPVLVVGDSDHNTVR